MKIIFNFSSTGCGNNGGTRTILSCQKILEKLGHRVDVLSTVDNFTWFSHKKVINKIPDDTEVIIATGCQSVWSTLNSKVLKKAWYIRGHENWSMSEEKLSALYKDPRIFKIVNSKGLQELLKEEFSVPSEVIYQGIDLNLWKDNKKNFSNDGPIRIGCLAHKRVSKKWQEFVKLYQILKDEKKYEFVAFGNCPSPANWLTKYYENPSHGELVKLYNSCHIFFCPTNLEGLHNIGMEAALCGCLIICNDNPMNGMILDYAFDNKTAMIYPEENIQAVANLIKNPNWDLIEPMQKHIKESIGTREQNMTNFIKLLEKI